MPFPVSWGGRGAQGQRGCGAAVAAGPQEPHCTFSSQARDCARKLEALKPLFVEPRSKDSFSEVRVRWAPLPCGCPGLAAVPPRWCVAAVCAWACCLLGSLGAGMVAAGAWAERLPVPPCVFWETEQPWVLGGQPGSPAMKRLQRRVHGPPSWRWRGQGLLRVTRLLPGDGCLLRERRLPRVPRGHLPGCVPGEGESGPARTACLSSPTGAHDCGLGDCAAGGTGRSLPLGPTSSKHEFGGQPPDPGWGRRGGHGWDRGGGSKNVTSGGGVLGVWARVGGLSLTAHTWELVA